MSYLIPVTIEAFISKKKESSENFVDDDFRIGASLKVVIC